MFPTSGTATKRIKRVIDTDNSRLKLTVPQEQRTEDESLLSFQVERHSTSAVTGLSTQVHADLWRRQSGRMNYRTMASLRQKNDSGLRFHRHTIRLQHLPHHQPPTESTSQEDRAQDDRVYEAFLHRPLGAHQSLSKGNVFVRQHVYRRLHEDDGDIFAKGQGLGSRLFTLVFRIRRVGVDKGTEYTSSSSEGFGTDFGISLESAVPAHPQYVVVWEKDDRTITTIAKCLFTHGNFPVKY